MRLSLLMRLASLLSRLLGFRLRPLALGEIAHVATQTAQYVAVDGLWLPFDVRIAVVRPQLPAIYCAVWVATFAISPSASVRRLKPNRRGRTASSHIRSGNRITYPVADLAPIAGDAKQHR